MAEPKRGRQTAAGAVTPPKPTTPPPPPPAPGAAPPPGSKDVQAWITYFNEMPFGPGWGVGVLLDEIERLRAVEQRAREVAALDLTDDAHPDLLVCRDTAHQILTGEVR